DTRPDQTRRRRIRAIRRKTKSIVASKSVSQNGERNVTAWCTPGKPVSDGSAISGQQSDIDSHRDGPVQFLPASAPPEVATARIIPGDQNIRALETNTAQT